MYCVINRAFSSSTFDGFKEYEFYLPRLYFHSIKKNDSFPSSSGAQQQVLVIHTAMSISGRLVILSWPKPVSIFSLSMVYSRARSASLGKEAWMWPKSRQTWAPPTFVLPRISTFPQLSTPTCPRGSDDSETRHLNKALFQYWTTVPELEI